MSPNLRFAASLVFYALLTGCSSDSANEGASTQGTFTSQASPAVAPGSPRQVDESCPADGLWAVCSVEKRLKQSGFVAQKTDSVGEKRAGFSVMPVAYTLNRSRLELYIYDDAAALQREISRIDTTRVAPVFIRSGNLAALLFTDDGTQAERLSLALTAGAPQR